MRGELASLRMWGHSGKMEPGGRAQSPTRWLPALGLPASTLRIRVRGPHYSSPS